MGRETVDRARSASSSLSVLVVTVDAAGGAAAAAVGLAGHELLPTHALTLPSALATLVSQTFDCVLIEVGYPDLAAVEVVHAVARRSGGAALVALADGGPMAPELHDLVDLVLHPTDLEGRWVQQLRACVERADLREELRSAHTSIARLSGIVDSVADAVFTTTTDGYVTSWNRGAENLYGYRADDMIGQHLRLLHPPGSPLPERLVSMVARGEQVRGLETVRRTSDGRMEEVTLDVTPLDDGRADQVTGLVVVAQDISERRELEAELVRVTMHDVLTGLPNRSYLHYRLTQALVEARRCEQPVAVLYIDLDQFKAVDDVYGHLIGDQVLSRVAERLRTVARPADIVARVGGDEFVLVCPGADETVARLVADEVIESVAAPISVERRTLRVGASVGIAVAPPVDADAELLLKHADAAMGDAKARGRARSQLFDPTFARRAADERRLAADLREALHRGSLEVHYQRVVDLDTDRTVGVEALARWNHPVDGPVSPATFVTLAEKHGFVTELDRFVLDRACTDMMAAIQVGDLPPTIRVAVNLSARTLDEPGLALVVDEVARRTRFPLDSLVLEVTETALLQNLDAARSSLEDLRALGAGVFLDDFGTGYSSLSFLRELPVTGVKIDRSFVRDAVDRPEDLAITEAILRLANGLGLATVAEGVETVAQRDLLRRLGCSTAQGFWWGPAVPLNQLSDGARLERRREPRTSTAAPRRWGVTRRQVVQADTRTACCLRGGLEAGQGWLVVTSPARREAFARSLGRLHASAVARGQLVELDAYDTLRAVTGADGRLDPARFEQVVGTALRRVGAAADEVGVHAELGHVNQPLVSLRVSTDLRRKLHAEQHLALEHGDQPADCAGHGPLQLGLFGSTETNVS